MISSTEIVVGVQKMLVIVAFWENGILWNKGYGVHVREGLWISNNLNLLKVDSWHVIDYIGLGALDIRQMTNHM